MKCDNCSEQIVGIGYHVDDAYICPKCVTDAVRTLEKNRLGVLADVLYNSLYDHMITSSQIKEEDWGYIGDE